MQPGSQNAITDVEGVLVGHVSLYSGEPGGDGPIVRTGVTAVLPHAGNLFREKVPAAVHVINGFGKAVGFTQVQELGVLETPIILTNTLSVGAGFDGLVEHALRENPEICHTTGSVNPVVLECNDWLLNDIRGRHVRVDHVLEAIQTAADGRVAEGAVGAGTGMIAYGWKGGIGTASRTLPARLGRSVVGVLALANFGRAGDLAIASLRVGEIVEPPPVCAGSLSERPQGSCVVVLATDAPASTRQLGRLARRVQSGLARTGSFCEHGSGEYVIAFSTARTVPHWPEERSYERHQLLEDGPLVDALFTAVVEATEEAVVNALFTAETVRGLDGNVAHALPSAPVLEAIRSNSPQTMR